MTVGSIASPLTGGSEYRFQVQAKNTNGWGALSGVGTYVASYDPNAPQNIGYYSSSVSTVFAKWDEPAITTANDAVFIKYQVAYTDMTTGAAEQYLDIPPAQRYGGPTTSLTTGNTIQLKVKACNRNACGGWSSTTNLVVGGLPEKTDVPYVINSTSTAINIGWSYVGKNNGGVLINRFAVLVSANGGASYSLAGYTDSAAQTNFNYPCTSGTTYYLKVAALNGVGGATATGPHSDYTSALCTSAPDTPLSAPTLSATMTSITVNLYTPTALQLNSATHTGWRIYIDV
jgi:hypothetical protein